MKDFFMIFWLFLFSLELFSNNSDNSENWEHKSPFSDTLIVIITDTLQTDNITKGNSFWIPNEIQILHMDSLLNVAFKNVSSRGEIFDLKKYYKQCVCYKERNGDLIIYINGFCRLPEMIITDSFGNDRFVPRDWRKEIIIVKDGGSCYWRLKINLTKMIYFDFIINGKA